VVARLANIANQRLIGQPVVADRTGHVDRQEQRYGPVTAHGEPHRQRRNRATGHVHEPLFVAFAGHGDIADRVIVSATSRPTSSERRDRIR
jgi:hypothetical protein